MDDDQLYCYQITAVFEVIASDKEEAMSLFEAGTGEYMDCINVRRLYEI